MSKNKSKCSVNSNQPQNKKQFKSEDLISILPKTPAQKDFFQIYDREYPIIVSHGVAGSGKTFISLYCLLGDLFKDYSYDKIIIIRSSVQARDIGFLPGKEDEKNELYETPYIALLDELLHYKSNNYKNLKKMGLLEFNNTSFLRGMTFDNSLILVDEFQSMSYHELSTIITRVGSNSRILFCGDDMQCDLHRRDDLSGYSKFMNVLSGMDEVAFVEFGIDDIVRSDIVKSFLISEHNLFSVGKKG